MVHQGVSWHAVYNKRLWLRITSLIHPTEPQLILLTQRYVDATARYLYYLQQSPQSHWRHSPSHSTVRAPVRRWRRCHTLLPRKCVHIYYLLSDWQSHLLFSGSLQILAMGGLNPLAQWPVRTCRQLGETMLSQFFLPGRTSGPSGVAISDIRAANHEVDFTRMLTACVFAG